MYTYKLKIKKVSGRLNESVLPSKNLLIKSKKSLSKKAILKEANTYFKKKYGLTVESLEIWDNDDLKNVNDILRSAYSRWANSSVKGKQNKASLHFVMNLMRDCYEEFKNSKYSNHMHRFEDDVDYENEYEMDEYIDINLSKLEMKIMDNIMYEVSKFEKSTMGRRCNFAWLYNVDLRNKNIAPMIKEIFEHIKTHALATDDRKSDYNIGYDSHTQIDDIMGIDMY